MHVGDVLPVDEDAPARRLVEAEQQPRDRRLAGARGADDGDGLARRHLERDALAGSGAPGCRRTARPRSAPRPPGRRAAARPAGPAISGSASQDREHVVDVDERLFDLAVEHAHEVQRHVELHQHGVDQHEAADRARGRAMMSARRQDHHDRHADGEDHGLAGIQHRERGVGLGRGALVALHRAVVARRLARLGAEIFHRLVIEQRVDRLGVGVHVGLVHPAADRDPPLRGLVGIGQIDGDHRQNDDRVEPVELPRRGCRSRARTRRSWG